MGYILSSDMTFVHTDVSQPWQVKYRISEYPERILSAQLVSPNDHLRVKEKGLYEVLEVGPTQFRRSGNTTR